MNENTTVSKIKNEESKLREEKRIRDLSKSRAWQIRENIAESKDTTAEILKDMLIREIRQYKNTDVLNAILKNPRLEVDKELFLEMSRTDSWKIRKRAAEASVATNEDLKVMLDIELKNHKDKDVIEAILNRKELEVDNEDLLKKLSEHEEWNFRLYAVKSHFVTSRILNDTLIRELQNDNNRNVIDAILKNKNLELEKETLEEMAKSEICTLRNMAAKSLLLSSETLDEMLIREIKTYKYNERTTIKNLLSNPNLEVNSEILKEVFSSRVIGTRKMAAESELNTEESLNYMFEKEIEDSKDINVILSIINNPKFRIDKEKWLKLARVNRRQLRKKATELKIATAEDLKEMLEEEVKRYNDLEVIKAIKNNPKLESEEV